jgi:transposase
MTKRSWLAEARRCQIPDFVELYHPITKHRDGIVASVTHGPSNGLTESVNTKLRLLTRVADGFRSTGNLIALCLLDRGGHAPARRIEHTVHPHPARLQLPSTTSD